MDYKLNDISVIEHLKIIHEAYSKKTDWWDEISNAEKESIKRGIEDIKAGNVHSHEEVKKIYEKYL